MNDCVDTCLPGYGKGGKSIESCPAMERVTNREECKNLIVSQIISSDKFHGNRRSKQRQIGNAVPAALAKKVFDHLQESLD